MCLVSRLLLLFILVYAVLCRYFLTLAHLMTKISGFSFTSFCVNIATSWNIHRHVSTKQKQFWFSMRHLLRRGWSQTSQPSWSHILLSGSWFGPNTIYINYIHWILKQYNCKYKKFPHQINIKINQFHINMYILIKIKCKFKMKCKFKTKCKCILTNTKLKRKLNIQNILKSINQHKYVISLLLNFKLLNLFEFKLDTIH